MVEYLEKISKVAGKKKTIRDKYDDPEIDRQLRALRTDHRNCFLRNLFLNLSLRPETTLGLAALS